MEEGQEKKLCLTNDIDWSTGVGKTEARRLYSCKCPFIKVEASKFTEVGYVGRDVEFIVRDLMDTAVSMVTREKEMTL